MILPNYIWAKIYEYDSTYKEKYDELMNELIMSTCYWTTISSLNIEKIFKVYRMSHLEAKKTSSYWNKRYNSISLLKNLSTQQRIHLTNNPIAYTYPEYVSDVLPNQPYFREKFYNRRKFNKK